MNQSDAIKILIRAVQVAQGKGAYNLDEASTIHQAVSCFVSRTSGEDSNAQTNQLETATTTVNDTKNVTNS